jgi:hypothetical protein
MNSNEKMTANRVHSWLFALALMALLACPCVVHGATEGDPARRLWMRGYESMTQADQSYGNKAELTALRGYEKALEVFLEVQNRYPDWNVSLLRYRVDYCRKRIEEIKEANRQNLEYLTREELFQRVRDAESESRVGKERIQALEKTLEKERQSLERARGEAAQMATAEENLKILKKDRETLLAQVRTLSAQLEDAKTRLQQSATPDPRLARLEELAEQQRRSQEELTRVGRLLEQTAAARDELLSQSQRDAQWRRDAEARERELQRVAESARRQQESAELELRKAQASLESLENANRELSKSRQENAQGVQKELEETRSQLRAREDQLQSAQMELLSAQRRLRQAEDSATRLGEELSQERIRSRTSADAVSDQLQSVGRLQAERAELSDQVERQKSALAASQELLSGLEASSRQREEELSAAKSRVAELEKALSGAREEATQAKESLRQIQEASPATAGILANARETQQESEELHRRQQEQETELVALREKLDQSESARARLEEQLTRLSDEGRAQDAAVWQERVQELQKSLEESQSRQADLEASLVRRSQEQRSWERELEELRKQLDDAQKNVGSAGGSASGDGAVAAASSSSVAVPAGASAGVRPEVGVGEGGISASDQVLIRGFLRQALEAEQQGKREGARWNYQQALRLQPDNFLALKRLGLMASADGNDAEAAGFLSAALRKDPDDGEALLALGFAQLQLKQPEWSLATLARAAALVPREARTARLFGEALASMGWREAAAIQLKKAFELEEKDGEAAFNLAMLQLTRASELQLEARKDLPNRQALERLADQLRKDGLQWYQRAVALGIQEDPQLEKALLRANSPQ